MKNFINITVFVPVAEPYDEDDGLKVSIDRMGEVTLVTQFHVYDGASQNQGTFCEFTLRAALARLQNAFENAKKALEE
jgi:hypothetical protein